jgi:glycerol-3-phosphate O-acyltransferase/dihydroxyacetone phosphate acyltransferase
MRTGTARIALESEAENGFRLGSLVVPVGIHFESSTRFRSRVLVRIGRPIVAAEYADAYDRDPREAVLELTESLRKRLAALIVNLERSELDQLVSDVEAIYREELLHRRDLEIPGRSPFAKNVHLSQEIAKAVGFYAVRDPGLVLRLQRLLAEYRRKRRRLRLSDEFLRGTRGPSLGGELARLGASALFALPVAGYGALWNFVPYKLTGRVAKRLAADETKVHYYQLSVGAVLYLLYYPPLLFAAFKVLGVLPGALFGVSLVPTGFFARWYARRLWRRGAGVHYAYLALTKGYYVQDLIRLRRRIIAGMDDAVAGYLEARDEA